MINEARNKEKVIQQQCFKSLVKHKNDQINKRKATDMMVKRLERLQKSSSFNKLKQHWSTKARVDMKTHFSKIDRMLEQHEHKISSLITETSELYFNKTSKDEFEKVVNSLDKHRAISIYKDMQLYVDEVLNDFKRDQKGIQKLYKNVYELIKNYKPIMGNKSNIFTVSPFQTEIQNKTQFDLTDDHHNISEISEPKDTSKEFYEMSSKLDPKFDSQFIQKDEMQQVFQKINDLERTVHDLKIHEQN